MTPEPNPSTRTAVDDLSQAWNLRDSTLLRSDGEPMQTSRFDRNISPDRLQEALDRGAKTVRESAPNRDGYAVPLHENGNPTTTNEYVLWRPDSAQVGWYDTSFGIDGTVRFVSVETASETTLSDRLRFWHPELTPVSEDELKAFELPKSEVRPQSDLSADERRAFFDELRQFVESERETEQRANRERYRKEGLATLAARGVASGPFVSLGANDRPVEPTYSFQISPEDDDGDVDLFRDEEMYPESVFLVDTMGESDDFPIAVEIVSVDGPTLTLKPDASCERSGVEELLTANRSEFWLTHLLNPVPFERRTEAIRKIESTPKKRDLIVGNRPVRFEADGLSVPSADMELNEYQRQALKWADDAKDILCIHGPPGTGKTRTLTAYVLYAVQHGDSVLVTAHSNQAVDNLLVGDSAVGDPEPDTLHAAVCRARESDEGGDGNVSGDGLSIARVGRNSKNDVVRRNYTNAPVAEADIVAATTSGTAQFDMNRFDVAVVDEATQASRPATAIVLDCARKLVLSGDHKQLPPYCADESMKDERLHVSLFEYLLDRYGTDVSVLLRRQYRMHSAIAEFPNAAFYDGNLETAARNREWRIDDLESLVAIDVAGDERRESVGNSVYNPAEAQAVVAEVTKLVDAGVAPKDIGVISMYRGQVGEIRSRLRRTDEDAGRVTVDTVDSFQGGEREAVVVSFVRSNDAGNAGFLELPNEGPRRLNVALTRARKRLVLVGDWETLASVSPNSRPENSCAHLYAELATKLEREGRFVN
ncbi:AAA domain-containing protein [Haladaptatus sp. CMAA 1911]|uniref:AAA domain-containing protein n=1 Tax=unclassified Haladaptatus TaxID=2622732 RepID=UPI00375527C2